MQPKIYSTKEHGINHDLIDPDALTVLKRLRQAGHTAYIVGGGVRDLLINKKPKDFDISTSASPEEVKEIFRRQCILIGRRFRLAHIRFGHKCIEVATFRSGDNDDTELIVRDNIWGTPEQDVLRRDFTVNGLFYDAAEDAVIDYVGGWDDIHRGILRTIGTPAVRFRQDPVRMIRALKFRARFGFDIEPDVEESINACREEITKSAPARILEELFKMLESGAAAPFFKLMNDYGFLSILLPGFTSFLNGPAGEGIYKLLEAADSVHQQHEGRTIDRSVLATCLLYPIVDLELHTEYREQGLPPHLGNITTLTSSVIKEVLTNSFSHFPRRIQAAMSFIITTQYRFLPIAGKRHFRTSLFHHNEFPPALQFLKLRACADEGLIETYLDWKKRYHHSTHPSEKKHHPAPRRRRPRRRKTP